jgi:hypothetical protein
MISKKLIIPALIVLTAGSVVAVLPLKVNAQTGGSPLSGLVQMIAQKFNLDQTQVQSVFDQYRTQQKADMAKDMEQRQSERLAKLVIDGKITEVQKQAIVTKLTELRAKYDPLKSKNLSPEERRTQMTNQREEFTNWAKTQGIDPTVVMPGFGMGGRGRMHGEWSGDRPIPTPSK